MNSLRSIPRQGDENNVKVNIISSLANRSYGLVSFNSVESATLLGPRSSAACDEIHKLVLELKRTIDNANWRGVGNVTGTLVNKLLDQLGGGDPADSSQRGSVGRNRTRRDREMFVALGGVSQLFRLLQPPLVPPDARSISESQVKGRQDIWNEVLVLLREICFATPHLADRVATRTHIIFLFTMLQHTCVFENSMNLLEEILAVRNEAFSLADIPKFYEMVEKFTTRQLAHFCRVLALILFESEDRAIMESSRVLRSFELLQLRRDRMCRGSLNIVELNQSLVIAMPGFLSKLVSLLQILNYGPPLSTYVRHNMAGHVPLSSDILDALSGRTDRDEWGHFTLLDNIAQRTPLGIKMGHPRYSTTQTVPSVHQQQAEINAGGEEVMAQLLQCFSATGRGETNDPLDNIIHIIQTAKWLGIVSNQDRGGDSVVSQLLQLGEMNALTTLPQSGPEGGRNRGTTAMEELRSRPHGDSLYKTYTPRDALHELQFHAMVLAPHQVEILFVMCTLLSGRRKLHVQNELKAAGISKTLDQMYTRMSWDAPPFTGINPLEHIHGPDCECNPESSLRVQFLRLVHNYYDRDFMNNHLKSDLLSDSDLAQLGNAAVSSQLQAYRSDRLMPTGGSEKGLMARIVDTLVKEPNDSIYQFWLCSCLECFLRGQPIEIQGYFANSGVMKHLFSHVITFNILPHAESSLQTTFDLLGELVKYNKKTVLLFSELIIADEIQDGGTNVYIPAAVGQSINDDTIRRIESGLSSKSIPYGFRKFVTVVLDNIVDSNVFLRSLYLSLELIFDEAVRSQNDMQQTIESTSDSEIMDTETTSYRPAEIASKPASVFNPVLETGYLTHSWLQFSPKIRVKSELLGANRFYEKLDPANTIKSVRTSGSDKEVPRSVIGREAGILSSISNGVAGVLRAAGSVFARGLSQNNNDLDNIYGDSSVVPECVDKRVLGCSFNRSEHEHTSECFATTDSLCMRRCLSSLQQRSEYDKTIELPSSLNGISSFLLLAKPVILFKLMSTVTLRSINHENICCLNTAILVMLFEYKRGSLGKLLSQVREVAAVYSVCTCRASVEKSQAMPPVALSATEGDVLIQASETTAPPITLSNNSKRSASHHAMSRDGCMFCKPYRLPTESDAQVELTEEDPTLEICNVSQDCRVFINFRQLLWYWNEYYLRRGRDRLSLEFSSHIPFSVWKEVVDVLCKDDSSPTSLLCRHLVPPISPYRRMSPVATSVLVGNNFEEHGHPTGKTFR